MLLQTTSRPPAPVRVDVEEPHAARRLATGVLLLIVVLPLRLAVLARVVVAARLRGAVAVAL
eukprot:3411762-Alexandrium_andersonii.AAC.1